MKRINITTILYLLFSFFFIDTVLAQTAEEDPAKAAQNPLANVISLPLQNNANFGIGTYNKTSDILNIQPILPVKLNKSGWLLINRFIIPFPTSVPDQSSEDANNITGLGDISYTVWFSPPPKSKMTIGFGLVSIWPTASKDILGKGKFSIGPSFVLVYPQTHGLIAAVISNWFSVGGDENRSDVNTFYFQYILTRFLQKKWYITSAPINLANWEAESGQKWTIPLGGGFGKMFNIGKLPMDLSTQAFHNVVRPDGAADWQWRLQLKFIFPIGKK